VPQAVNCNELSADSIFTVAAFYQIFDGLTGLIRGCFTGHPMGATIALVSVILALAVGARLYKAE